MTGQPAATGDEPLAAVTGDRHWYKDAVVYQLHIKAFFDSNNDGIGDFAGLTEKLDYVKDLGVNTIWLLPFYPSPLRDDGYDVADYRNVHASYGTRADFQHFVREAHRRDLRVITELIVNHTSDQHPWFQAARRAPKGSSKRDWYVWSDDPEKYRGTRIIFTDTEKSNWAWDDVAKAYYWHRFFSHQPDLNFDNPQVRKAIFRVMRFWLDMGVDGFRLDAIPYLVEREGTNNENLPETHVVLKELRALVDAHYPNVLLLAEANQWPEDVREYFGEGDECHMAYHFPLMPRMYMAMAQEDRHPITEIMYQTPDIPANCQWAIFLRNHDELTLEMVTSKERDYMYQMYAADPRARINVGIRRRLAPLLENDVNRIKLMNSLLLSMPGSPILYYGDEIGMGDNIYLGDRDGVRTPMQWRPERNAGFSHADPQRLYLPPIMDAVFGYEAVNVEAQLRAPSSLLNWTRRMLSVRRGFRSFGRGKLTFLRPGNRKILAYVREFGDEVVLCVANLARNAQPVELDLVRFRGRVPLELMGRTPFPPIGDLPYLLTLTGHGFLWFRLVADADVPSWHEERLPREELPVLVLFDGWSSLFRDRVVPWRISLAEKGRAQLEREVLPEFVAGRRWYAAKGDPVRRVALVDHVEWQQADRAWLVALARVENEKRRPAELLSAADAGLGRRCRRAAARPRATHCRPHPPAGQGRRDGRRVRRRRVLPRAGDGHRCADGTRDGARDDPLHANRRVQPPRRRCSRRAAGRTARRAKQQYRGGPWRQAVSESVPAAAAWRESGGGNRPLPDRCRGLRPRRPGRRHGRARRPGWAGDDACAPARLYAESGRRLGQDPQLSRAVPRTAARARRAPAAANRGSRRIPGADAHARRANRGNARGAFARTRRPGIRTRAATPADVTGWTRRTRGDARATLDLLERRLASLPASARDEASRVLAARSAILDRIDAHGQDSGGTRARIHGDYHLGQVLVVQNDFVIIDFEGEPARSLAERREKQSPMKDVAGMLRSFDYALNAALLRINSHSSDGAERRQMLGLQWLEATRLAFLDGYDSVAKGAGIATSAAQRRGLLELFLLEKVMYEISYEVENRPDWVRIPLRGLIELLDTRG